MVTSKLIASRTYKPFTHFYSVNIMIRKKHDDNVQIVHYVLCNIENDEILGLIFAFSEPTNELNNNSLFLLQPPYEFVVCIRYDILDNGKLKAIQIQTNLGRRSKFFGYSSSSTGGKRHELYSEPGKAIMGFSKNESNYFQIQTIPSPYIKRKKLRKLLFLPSVRNLILKSEDQHSSVVMKMLHGGRKSAALHSVRHGLASKMFSVGEDGDALVRLILEGEEHVPRRSSSSLFSNISSKLTRSSTLNKKNEEEDDDNMEINNNSEEENEEESALVAFPSSVLRALCDKGEAFNFSLMELLTAGRERSGRPPIIRMLFESGIAKIVFHHRKDLPSLAHLMLTPNRTKGLRSLLQLMTDEEALDDANRPCVLRSMLITEETGDIPSILRMMFLKTPGRTITSLFDTLLRGEAEFGDSIARRLLHESPEKPFSLGRMFFSDTPSGKPSLAKYVFGGETTNRISTSLMRLMVQGEARNQNSLFRLLVGFPGDSGLTLMDLLTIGQPSLIDIFLKGEETADELSLARLMLGTTLTIQNGRFVMGSMLGDFTSSHTVSSSSTSNIALVEDRQKEILKKRLKKGMTFAKSCMLGEEDGGPGISVMRVMLLGEEQGSSILRLLCTGEAKGEVSPLRIILTGMHAAFVAAKIASDSSKAIKQEGLLEIAKNPSKWGVTLQKVMKAVTESINESHSANGSWKESFEKLIELGKQSIFQSSDSWEENIAFLWTAFARIRSMGPEFAKAWKKQFLLVAKEIRLTGERVKPESPWKELAPNFSELLETIAEQKWQKVFIDVAHIVQAIEKAAGMTRNKHLDSLLDFFEVLSNFAPRWF